MPHSIMFGMLRLFYINCFICTVLGFLFDLCEQITDDSKCFELIDALSVYETTRHVVRGPTYMDVSLSYQQTHGDEVQSDGRTSWVCCTSLADDTAVTHCAGHTYVNVSLQLAATNLTVNRLQLFQLTVSFNVTQSATDFLSKNKTRNSSV